MISMNTLRELALSFPETTEEPHFEKTSFKVKKKIFATYDEINKRVCLKLSQTNQDIFCLTDKSIIYPVDNRWGKQGWTLIEMKQVRKNLFIEALINAYCEVAPKKLSESVKNKTYQSKTTNGCTKRF